MCHWICILVAISGLLGCFFFTGVQWKVGRNIILNCKMNLEPLPFSPWFSPFSMWTRPFLLDVSSCSGSLDFSHSLRHIQKLGFQETGWNWAVVPVDFCRFALTKTLRCGLCQELAHLHPELRSTYGLVQKQKPPKPEDGAEQKGFKREWYGDGSSYLWICHVFVE